MKKTAKKRAAARPLPRAHGPNNHQRERLIDACITALHTHGPSRTTVEKVVAVAKMSPGIVRFYFDSKAALLVATLEFLAAEFEEQVMVPVAKLKLTPVAALELLVDLYFDPDIASARKVSVWYAFWGEASSRQEYYDICGQKDESFAALVHELVARLIGQCDNPRLDADGIALGLIGALEILWQDIAFQSERDIDRGAARRRCHAYLGSVFPAEFAAQSRAPDGGRRAPATTAPLAAWVYDSPRMLAVERRTLFVPSWQLAGTAAQLLHAGDFLGPELAADRALLVRDAFGALHALRNSCPASPHALVDARSGRFERDIACARHGLTFGLDGKRADSSGHADLGVLHLHSSGGLLLVRSGQNGRPGSTAAWEGVAPSSGVGLLGAPTEQAIAADWKVVVEQWLDAAPPGLGGTEPLEYFDWPTPHDWRERFIAPNHLIESRPDGVSVLQVVPVAAGRCVMRRFDLSRLESVRDGRAARDLAASLSASGWKTVAAAAESTQKGIADFGYRPSSGADPDSALALFRRALIAAIPESTQARAPLEL